MLQKKRMREAREKEGERREREDGLRKKKVGTEEAGSVKGV